LGIAPTATVNTDPLAGAPAETAVGANAVATVGAEMTEVVTTLACAAGLAVDAAVGAEATVVEDAVVGADVGEAGPHPATSISMPKSKPAGESVAFFETFGTSALTQRVGFVPATRTAC